MELLGDRNWWLPAWLDRLLPHLRLDADNTPTSDTTTFTPQPQPAGNHVH